MRSWPVITMATRKARAKTHRSGGLLTQALKRRSVSDSSMTSGATGLSFWELHGRVRQQDGGLLIGFRRHDSGDGRDRNNAPSLVPNEDRDLRLQWVEEHELVVLRPSNETYHQRSQSDI